MTASILSKSNCKFKTITPNTLDFGTINPTSSTSATATLATWTFACGGSAPTASFAITADNGLHNAGSIKQMQHSTVTTELLPYSLDVSPATGNAARGAIVTLTITGTVLPADFKNAIAGAYSDKVKVTLTP
ncbi:spore coat protein U domain-containing protein [Ramlibacter sp. MMS24-I3-19]|uniref:spore coat protein U domain-containing protein n=1 Tax=Ramlibacter sp. MMS24-I3-19 TaxID=3416606 RepID=UPI003D070B30